MTESTALVVCEESSHQELNRTKGFLGTTLGEVTDVATAGAPALLTAIRALGNDELLRQGELAMQDIGDNLLVLDELRQRFRQGKRFKGYEGWLDFVARNSRYSPRVIQTKLAEVNGKDETKVNKNTGNMYTRATEVNTYAVENYGDINPKTGIPYNKFPQHTETVPGVGEVTVLNSGGGSNRGHGMVLSRWRPVAESLGYKLGCESGNYILNKDGTKTNLGCHEGPLRIFLTKPVHGAPPLTGGKPAPGGLSPVFAKDDPKRLGFGLDSDNGLPRRWNTIEREEKPYGCTLGNLRDRIEEVATHFDNPFTYLGLTQKFKVPTGATQAEALLTRKTLSIPAQWKDTKGKIKGTTNVQWMNGNLLNRLISAVEDGETEPNEAVRIEPTPLGAARAAATKQSGWTEPKKEVEDVSDDWKVREFGKGCFTRHEKKGKALLSVIASKFSDYSWGGWSPWRPTMDSDTKAGYVPVENRYRVTLYLSDKEITGLECTVKYNACKEALKTKSGKRFIKKVAAKAAARTAKKKR
jgi:hypothetical protein